MIAHLRGSILKLNPGEVHIDVDGVGYRVTVPLDVWDNMEEASQHMLWISSYVREDRFELFGFADRTGRTLFEEFLKKQGVGPKLALELCAVPRTLLLQAIHEQDDRLLTSVKGIGKKTAEKLLIDLKAMLEKDPTIFGAVTSESNVRGAFDHDAAAALRSLGYDTPTVMQVLKDLPADLTSTEERVAAALRSL
jgi:Holliday junction DNA helicase RuvA